MKYKKCFKCGENKTVSHYYKHKGMRDGLLGKCKECAKSDAIKNREENRDYYRAYDISRGNRQSPVYVKEWREKNPKKYRAQNIVNNAIRDKKLFREPCEICGAKKAHAHHDDYSKPLNVRWLCPAHHREWHDKNGEGKNAK